MLFDNSWGSAATVVVQKNNLIVIQMSKKMKINPGLPQTMAALPATEIELMALKHALEQMDDRDEFEDELLEQLGSGSFSSGDDEEDYEGTDCFGTLCASFWIKGWPVNITVETVDLDSIFRLLFTLFRGEA